jgi:aminoglycoside phosphotransferase (APT) family kinase protein
MSNAQFTSDPDIVPQHWRQLADHLRASDLALDGSLAPRQFAGGFGNLNYLLRINGADMVLRRPPLGPIPPGANDMAREYRVLSALNPVFPLAPKPQHFCADPAVLGAPFLLLDFRPGLIIRDDLPPPHATADAGAKLSQMLVETLAALHTIEPVAIGLGELGRPEGFLTRTITAGPCAPRWRLTARCWCRQPSSW